MLTRLYVDNFRCFVNFEFRPARKQLILGSNGTGKSSMLDALRFVGQFAVSNPAVDLAILNQKTRWMEQPQQTFELEAALESGSYLYRLVIEPAGLGLAATGPRVVSETVRIDGKPTFEFSDGEVRLYSDRLEITYPHDSRRSAFATIGVTTENQKLRRFRQWFEGLLCFRINPFNMGLLAEKGDPYPDLYLSNIAAWYRHLGADHNKNAAFIASLQSSIDGFNQLWFTEEQVKLLFAEFFHGDRKIQLGFHELSEGQRCLICLYAILHFVVAKGNTVILDEPDNFVSLREIQPWLNALTDAVEDGRGQVLLISHHPELINQWAPSSGVQLVRDGLGPVRVEKFQGDPKSSLSPSELVARGWESG